MIKAIEKIDIDVQIKHLKQIMEKKRSTTASDSNNVALSELQ